MKAMVLAAGRGERLRPLTDRVPKPLLTIGGKPLIVRVIEQLVINGIHDLVINTSWLADSLEQRLGDGRELDANIVFSREPPGALGTAGGIVEALPLLGNAPFVVVNADVFTDYPFANLELQADMLAQLVLIDNPAHVPAGDFNLDGDTVVSVAPAPYTFSGIGLYHPSMFASLSRGERALGPLLHTAARQRCLGGEHYEGLWLDVGTPERLAVANNEVTGRD